MGVQATRSHPPMPAEWQRDERGPAAVVDCSLRCVGGVQNRRKRAPRRERRYCFLLVCDPFSVTSRILSVAFFVLVSRGSGRVAYSEQRVRVEARAARNTLSLRAFPGRRAGIAIPK